VIGSSEGLLTCSDRLVISAARYRSLPRNVPLLAEIGSRSRASMSNLMIAQIVLWSTTSRRTSRAPANCWG